MRHAYKTIILIILKFVIKESIGNFYIWNFEPSPKKKKK